MSGRASVWSLPGMGTARALLKTLDRIANPAPAGNGSSRPLPEYVDYGALMTPPAPFRSLGTTLYGFWAQADPERLSALCRKVFAEPSGERVSARPIGHHVMLTWGLISRVVSQTPPYDQRGGVAEPQVAVWVPIVLHDPASERERFAMFIPYIWLDNAMSLATGRELFGYPKSWGWLKFPSDGAGDAAPRWKVDAFGLNYSPDALAARHRLLEVVRTGTAAEAAANDLVSLEELARDMAGHLFAHGGLLADLELAADAIGDIRAHRMRGVFLKQVRDVRDGLAAALQQLVEADYTILRLRARPILAEHRLTVRHLDSHPVREELGLESQTLGLAYEVEMDFDVGGGRVLWDAAEGGPRGPGGPGGGRGS
jgi:Acetoacetate decarboxylase (ADC)